MDVLRNYMKFTLFMYDWNFGYAISLNSNPVDKLNYRKFDRLTD